jgi:protein arginine N-methyltransferase 1
MAGSRQVLDPRTSLCCAEGLLLRTARGGAIEILREGARLRCPKHGLAIIELFSTPRTLSEALDAMRSRISGAQDWMDLTSSIQGLWEAGVLVTRGQQRTPRLTGSEFEFAPVHIAMLNDRARVQGYLAAIGQVVRKGDIVVDIGTGTGILAMAAARAGARHVYAVEASAIADAAQALFEANGLADRITLVRGWSTHVELPERADVMVSEIIGNDPLAEWVLETTTDARKRLLKPSARFVPHALTVYALPVTIPHSVKQRRAFTPRTVGGWAASYGFDFSPLLSGEWDSPSFTISPARARKWQTLSEPVSVADIAFGEDRPPAHQRTIGVQATRDGRLDGVLLYFDLELAQGIRVTTEPSRASGDNHWSCQVWALRHPFRLRCGDSFRLDYAYRVSGRPRIAAAPGRNK